LFIDETRLQQALIRRARLVVLLNHARALSLLGFQLHTWLKEIRVEFQRFVQRGQQTQLLVGVAALIRSAIKVRSVTTMPSQPAARVSTRRDRLPPLLIRRR